MPRHFPRWDGQTYPPIMTESEAYLAGYETGVCWDQFAPHNNYVPGGPYVGSREYISRDRELRDAYIDAQVRNNEEWRRGWADGRARVEPNPLPKDHVAVLGYN